MASPFYEQPGIIKYGDLSYEWLSLLKTPCYGFNGPNACYSSTCSHNPTISEPAKHKLSISTKSFKLKFNSRNSRSAERVPDYNAFRMSPTTQLNVQAKSFNLYDEHDAAFNGDDDCAYNGELDNVPLWSDASPIEETKDFNQLLDSPEFYFHPMANSSPINDVMDDTNFEHASSSEDGVSVKKYEFNPTVEPFHPMKKTFSDASSDTNISCSSPECIPTDISIDSSNTVETTETTSSEKSRTLPKKFVCILCPEKFSTLDELNQHIQNKVQQPCICIICGMSYAYHYQLQRHFSGHRSSKIFSCRCCHKKFRSLNQIRKHFDFCRFKLYLYI